MAAATSPPPPSPPDPYAELSIPPTATADQIRRAYKTACLRWHPDKHPSGRSRVQAETRFKAVVRAYTLLSDPTSRAAYDATRQSPEDPFTDPLYCKRFAAGFAQQFAKEGNPVDADKLFQSLFGHSERARFDERATKWQTMQKCEDRELDLPLTLEELYAGCTKKRRLKKQDGQTAAVLSIAVRPGYRPGDKVRFKDALVEEGKRPGDVVFILAQRPHPTFEVDADDLIMTMQVRLVDALAGAVLIVTGLDGNDVKIRVDQVIHPGFVHVVKGKGLPRRTCPEQFGDMRISFDIKFPTRVEAEDRTAVRDLFAKLEAHTNCRMAIRRSSSLFMSRGNPTNILSSRRSSTGAQESKPPVFPEKKDIKDEGDGAESNEEDNAPENASVQTSNVRPHSIQPSKSRIHKSILRFPSIFR